MSVSNYTGRLFVFEGPDGVGKTTIMQRVADILRKTSRDVIQLSFPGRGTGSLGRMVYEIHHDPASYGLSSIEGASLQLLHVAAHIDCINRELLPALRGGKTVLLDRYWWSTFVYGAVNGLTSSTLDSILSIENEAWDDVKPNNVFLLDTDNPFCPFSKEEIWHELKQRYALLAKIEAKKYPVKTVYNNGSINEIATAIATLILPEENQTTLPFVTDTVQHGSPQITEPLKTWLPTKTTPVFDTYWRFAAERQNIFYRRLKGSTNNVTTDPILRTFKFTNAYRASDRVSQYLIRNVIYEGDQSEEEVFFRIILFKTFNKIETWETLKQKVGEILYRKYDFMEYDAVLTEAKNTQPVYSAAYIMPSGSRSFGEAYKHRNHLKLIERMMGERLPIRVLKAKSMQEVFERLRSYPMIGDFLAFQYAIDINYSNLTDFSEMSFVVPGPGAKDGMRKCFSDFGGLSEIDIIRRMADRQEQEFERLDIDFKTLWGRRLQLIDCQNLFCEVDKYARMAHPNIMGLSGRTRIKQKFRPISRPIPYFYPPKWGINHAVNETLGSES